MTKELIQLRPLEDQPDTYWCVPGDGWGQGFATYGGYVAASCYKAAKLSGQPGPSEKSQEFGCGPRLLGYGPDLKEGW